MSRVIVAAIAITVMAVPAHALTSKELQEIANRIGRRVEYGTVWYEPTRRPSPSLVDLSTPPPGYVPPPYVPDPGAYSAKLEARSLKIFGYGREEERQRWMADYEQREIANKINASKPLLVPVNSR